MLIYLASPYTHLNKHVEDVRAREVTYVAGMLIKQGHHIFCPIAHCHQMNRMCDLGGRFDYWREFDEKMISVCTELWVVTFPGWQESVGVAAELDMARERDMPIRYVHPTLLEITDKPSPP